MAFMVPSKSNDSQLREDSEFGAEAGSGGCAHCMSSCRDGGSVFLLHPAVHFYETHRNLISLRVLWLSSYLSETC